ncbi:hypothetical protein BHE74_00012892 [Ensete ventricosum]|nr:hypothetical protein BHE74_00012892 [Ensete ventricosum]
MTVCCPLPIAHVAYGLLQYAASSSTAPLPCFSSSSSSSSSAFFLIFFLLHFFLFFHFPLPPLPSSSLTLSLNDYIVHFGILTLGMSGWTRPVPVYPWTDMEWKQQLDRDVETLKAKSNVLSLRSYLFQILFVLLSHHRAAKT